MQEQLDIRDISIIDSLPTLWEDPRTILTVGCGGCRLEHHIGNTCSDIAITATDIKKANKMMDGNYTFQQMDILHPNASLKSDVVICAQVLEHLFDWKKAFVNLIGLANVRVIVTIPYKASFHSPDHFNFWNDATVREYTHIAHPYSTAISRIRTKPEDYPNKGCFLIVVDKKQNYGI